MDFRENSSLFHADEFKMGKSCLSYALRIQFPSITFHSLHPIFFIQPRTSLSYELPKYPIPSAWARKLDQKMRCDDGREKNVETRNSARAFGALFSAQADLRFYQKKEKNFGASCTHTGSGARWSGLPKILFII